MRTSTLRTTPTFTSASSSAVRISPRISSTSASLNRPRLRSLETTLPSRSLNDSNMKEGI
jgi:hypothetical protein